MKKTVCLFFIALLQTFFLVAQTGAVATLVQQLEATGDNNAAVTTLLVRLKKDDLAPDDRLALQTVLVHKYQELQQWDICLNYCQQQVAAAHAANNTLAEATVYKLIGNTYYHIPDKEKAIQYWQKCIAISEASRFNLLLEQCYHNLGSVYLEGPDHYDRAEKYLQQSVKLSIANKTQNDALGRLHSRLLATLYERTNRLDQALKAYADVTEKSRQAKDSANLAEALMFTSDVLVKQKKYNEALQVSSEALVIARKVAKLDMIRTALDFHSMNLYAAGRYKESYEFKTEAAGILLRRYNNDLNDKLGEAEAKFKTAEAEHEKKLAIVKANKEMQVYILAVIGLFSIGGLLFYNFYQKKTTRQKMQLLSQVQDEKERLRRDLHDNLGSQMALLSNNIETLDINFRKQQDIESNIEKTKATSKLLLQTLRETIWILNKEQVTVQEFFDKLVDYSQRYLQSYPGMQLKVEENFTGNRQLNSNEALQLFRICQEAVTNACKYSGSPVLDLKGMSTAGIFKITIADAGRGFDIAAVNGDEHYGLKNMQQRAAAIHALLQLQPIPGKGTSVIISI